MVTSALTTLYYFNVKKDLKGVLFTPIYSGLFDNKFVCKTFPSNSDKIVINGLIGTGQVVVYGKTKNALYNFLGGANFIMKCQGDFETFFQKEKFYI